ncbi:MAG: hypothetical protein U1F68_03055 [Gammaproteobacteria bacterium]
MFERIREVCEMCLGHGSLSAADALFPATGRRPPKSWSLAYGGFANPWIAGTSRQGDGAISNSSASSLAEISLMMTINAERRA